MKRQKEDFLRAMAAWAQQNVGIVHRVVGLIPLADFFVDAAGSDAYRFWELSRKLSESLVRAITPSAIKSARVL
jgi:hypothetical protein